MNDADILRTLVDEHARNQARDSSYSVLNAELRAEDAREVERVTLYFIDRLFCDGVINLSKLRRLAARLADFPYCPYDAGGV